MMLAIRFCPFCGELKKIDVEYIDEFSGLSVRCGSCGAIGSPKSSEKDAIAAWNQRPYDYEDPYEKEPRRFDSHEIRCCQCEHSQKRTDDLSQGLEFLRPWYCPIWQVNVSSDEHCHYCIWHGDEE